MKTLNQLLWLLVLSIITGLFSSCRKTPVANMVVPGQVYSYYNHPYPQNTDGNIFFDVYNLANNPSYKNLAEIYGGFDSINSTVNGSGSVVSVAGYNLIPNLSQALFSGLANDSLFGKIISYSIKPPLNEGNTVLTGSFYSPAPIYATNIPRVFSVDIPPNAAFPITWNADANNTNGVNVSAEYSPLFLNNPALAASGDSIVLENHVMVPDNGNTSLPANFFSKFPTEATLQVYIGRGSAIYLQSGQYVYLINGFFSSGFFAVKK